LGALAEHHPMRCATPPTLAVRIHAEYLRLPAAWHQNPSEHLDGGRFAGTIWTETGDHFAALDGS
jgi:hypothetical protein